MVNLLSPICLICLLGTTWVGSSTPALALSLNPTLATDSTRLKIAVAIPPDIVGNTLATAFNIGQLDNTPTPRTFLEYVGPQDSADYYRFELQSSSVVNIKLAAAFGNAQLSLLDVAGNVIASSNSKGSRETISSTLPSGTFYVLVEAKNQKSPYSITLSAQFITNDVVVSDPSISVPDPEFDQVSYRVGWQDEASNLWVAPVDPSTGSFLLAQKQLIDTSLLPLSVSLNGPEWVYSIGGSQLVYSKLINSLSYLGLTQGTGVQLQAGLMPSSTLPQGPTGVSPIGSRNPQDTLPRVVYALANSGTYDMAWRGVYDATGGFVPIAASQRKSIGRWVNNESSALVYSALVNGVSQIFQFDVNTNTQTQLTFDALGKDNPYMWRAPEFNNELVFFALESGQPVVGNNATSIGVYRNINGVWTKIKNIVPPSQFPYINSPEFFVYNNKSYIFMVMKNSSGKKAEIWIAGIDPNFDFYRQVNNPAVVLERRDPESLIIGSGAVIYYTEMTPQGIRIIHRTDTGLGIPN
jgi:hypothetical protein